MDRVTKEFLFKLRETPEFQAIMQAMEEKRPMIPKWTPLGGDAGETLIEDIKFLTGVQLGYDKLFALLTGKAIQNGRADEQHAV